MKQYLGTKIRQGRDMSQADKRYEMAIFTNEPPFVLFDLLLFPKVKAKTPF